MNPFPMIRPLLVWLGLVASVFAISDPKGEKYPNLYGFADLFLSLGCKDALFLDGDISQMRSGENIGKQSNLFGSVIAVVE